MTTDSKSKWQGRKVLVDGAAGFIGSHLVERLVEEGATVRAFVRYTSRGEHGLLGDLPPDIAAQVETCLGDLRDRDAVVRACRGNDVVFHLGAITSGHYSQVHPVEVVETNVLGTLNVLVAARDAGVGRVVHASAGEVYGTAQADQISETHPLHGHTPYSASKIGADKLAESFHCSFGLPVVILRPFCTYGPRQSPRAIVPAIIIQVLTEDRLILESADQVRDLTFIQDTVEGFLAAGAAQGVAGETINLGANDEMTMSGVARLVLELVGRDVKIVARDVRAERCETMRLRSDNAKARALLGWEPRVPLRTGLRQTMSWIATRLDRYKEGAAQRVATF